jgi:hypothetical protein
MRLQRAGLLSLPPGAHRSHLALSLELRTEMVRLGQDQSHKRAKNVACQYTHAVQLKELLLRQLWGEVLHETMHVLGHYAAGKCIHHPEHGKHEASQCMLRFKQRFGDTDEEQECIEQRLQRRQNPKTIEW